MIDQILEIFIFLSILLYSNIFGDKDEPSAKKQQKTLIQIRASISRKTSERP